MSAVTRLYSERRAMYSVFTFSTMFARCAGLNCGLSVAAMNFLILTQYSPQAQVNLGDDGGGGLGAQLLGTLNLRPGLLEAARLEDAQLGHRLVRQAVLPPQQGRVEAGEDGGQLPRQLLANLPPHRAVGQLGESPLQLGRLIQALQRLKGLVHRFGHLLRVPPAGFTVHKEGQQVLYLLSSAAEVLKDGLATETRISDCIVSITVTAFWRMFRFFASGSLCSEARYQRASLPRLTAFCCSSAALAFVSSRSLHWALVARSAREVASCLATTSAASQLSTSSLAALCGLPSFERKSSFRVVTLRTLAVADVRLRVGLLEVLVLEQLRPLEHAVDAALDQVHLAPAGVHLALQLGHLADQTLEAEREVGAHGAGAQRRNGAGHQRARHHQVQPGHEEGAGGGGAAEGAHAVAHLGRRLGALLRAGHRRLQLVQLDVQLACLNRIFIRASSLTDFLRGAQVDFVCLFHLALHLLQQQVKVLGLFQSFKVLEHSQQMVFNCLQLVDAGADLAQLAGNRRVLHLRLGLVVGALQLVQLLEGEAEVEGKAEVDAQAEGGHHQVQLGGHQRADEVVLRQQRDHHLAHQADGRPGEVVQADGAAPPKQAPQRGVAHQHGDDDRGVGADEAGRLPHLEVAHRGGDLLDAAAKVVQLDAHLACDPKVNATFFLVLSTSYTAAATVHLNFEQLTVNAISVQRLHNCRQAAEKDKGDKEKKVEDGHDQPGRQLQRKEVEQTEEEDAAIEGGHKVPEDERRGEVPIENDQVHQQLGVLTNEHRCPEVVVVVVGEDVTIIFSVKCPAKERADRRQALAQHRVAIKGNCEMS
ncbi:hypothetical protein TYRP_011687 [Tyrophagus putrescentiae]|nr:hypothetical protein TYRP_011687 [Tyrophagus putrescentiae]